jgi:hypothetical protein
MSETLHYELHSKNAGRELRPKGQPQPVRVHDFAIPELGKAVPYGIYEFPPMLASSMSASAPTPESSPSRASAAGGARSALRVIQVQSSC